MFRIVLFASALIVLGSPSASAQTAVLSELYGRGVHAYYSNDYATAYDFLSKAIDGGIQDPRAYYFRGLTALATDRDADAEADFRAGAKLEAPGNFASVGPSLTRIQGSTRIMIENMRQQARLEYQTSAAARSKARYGEIESSDVLRERPQARAPMASPSRRPAPPAIPPAAANPFAGDNAVGDAVVEAPDALEGTMTDPFADDAAPAAAPAAGEPAPSDDPFSGGAAPAVDPFGTSEPAPTADPFGAGADPFQ